MAQQSYGGSGHAQSIGTQGEQPVDGIAGSHAGTQEPSGAHIDAGRTRHGKLQKEQGNEQSATTGTDKSPQRRTGSFAQAGRSVAQPGSGSADVASGAGNASYGGSGDSMQGGAQSRGQVTVEPAHAGAPTGTLQRGDLVQTGSWNKGN